MSRKTRRIMEAAAVKRMQLLRKIYGVLDSVTYEGNLVLQNHEEALEESKAYFNQWAVICHKTFNAKYVKSEIALFKSQVLNELYERKKQIAFAHTFKALVNYYGMQPDREIHSEDVVFKRETLNKFISELLPDYNSTDNVNDIYVDICVQTLLLSTNKQLTA